MGLLLSATAMAQVIRPFTKRYYNPSVKGSIVYVSNSIISSNGIGSGVPGTGEVPPGGSSTNNGGTGINIDVDNTTTTLIAYGSTWKYWNADSRPANWQTTAYSDALWPSGPAELGYGDGDEATCVPSSSSGTLCLPTGNKYMTNYFRQVINIPNPSTYASIIMNVIRDDGIVVHLYVHFARGTKVNDLPGGITPAEFLRAEILHVLQNLILEFRRQEEPPWRASYAWVNGRWGNGGGEGVDVFKAGHSATYP